MRSIEQSLDEGEVVLRVPEIIELKAKQVFVEHSNNQLFPVDHRRRRHSKILVVTALARNREAAILWQTMLSYVHVRDYFDTTYD